MATKNVQVKKAATTSAQAASYVELQAQIAELQAQAESVRQEEIANVVAEIKAQVAAYGLTATDLGLAPKAKRGRVEGRPIAYADGAGNTWGGRGKRPDWLRSALATGKTMDEFKVS